MFPPPKRVGGGGARKVLPCLEGGTESFGPAIFPFCSPHPIPVINDHPYRKKTTTSLFSLTSLLYASTLTPEYQTELARKTVRHSFLSFKRVTPQDT